MVRQGGDSASPSLPVWLGCFTTPALRRAVRSGDGFTVLGANREPYDRREWVLVPDTAIRMIRAFVDTAPITHFYSWALPPCRAQTHLELFASKVIPAFR
jgi:hypothetical protein